MDENAHVPREQRTVFGEVAELYDRVRPGYPEVLVDDVLALAGSAVPRSLEVGAGTGKATILFAKRGLEVVAIEPSPEMAAVASRNCLHFPQVLIEVSSFEDWPLQLEAFDLLISAQAWHWVAPEVRYVKAGQVLRPSGGLALFWNRPRWEDSAMRTALDALYEARAPEVNVREPGFPGLREPEADEERASEIEASGLFGPVTRRSYRWSCEYTVEDYLELLRTQSDHRMLPAEQREYLLRGVADVIEAACGVLRMDYDTHLWFARRLH
jgi:SAM-dependent methyltransferase